MYSCDFTLLTSHRHHTTTYHTHQAPVWSPQAPLRDYLHRCARAAHACVHPPRFEPMPPMPLASARDVRAALLAMLTAPRKWKSRCGWLKWGRSFMWVFKQKCLSLFFT